LILNIIKKESSDMKSIHMTKSLFNQAVTCPRKIYYQNHSDQYASKNSGNEFLKSLAEGGHQVGALAKLMFENGKEVKAKNHQGQIDETNGYLAQARIAIFEGAIQYGNFFARVDVMNKIGNTVELIEVKAKSYRSSESIPFRNTKGIDSKMLPYLRDIAFQRHVFSMAFPDLKVKAFLMLVDKDKKCSVDGLNQCFKVVKENDRAEIVVNAGTSLQTIGEPILSKVNVDELVDEILSKPLAIGSQTGPIMELASVWSQQLQDDQKPDMNVGTSCAGCEFRPVGNYDGKRNGFEECWGEAFGLKKDDVAKGTVLDIYDFKGKKKLIKEKVYLLSKVEKHHLAYSEGTTEISDSERQWMQVSGEWPGTAPFYFKRELFLTESKKWIYPLHFIDFETARVAIPFLKNQSPYSNVAFQFSVHTMQDDWSVAHAHEYLDTSATKSPNYDFVRALHEAVGDAGTVFMWSPHENTTLKQILEELKVSEKENTAPSDAPRLIAFIKSLTKRIDDQGREVVGDRAMYDLCKLAERSFFHPATSGRSTIKEVLPAVLDSSSFLRDRYSQPIYGAKDGIPSENFEDKAWWVIDGEHAKNPYKQLEPVFVGLSDAELEELESSEDMAIAEGGAATAAYTILISEGLSANERSRIEIALKSYCELDTLAMVMIFEAWRDWANNS
jgi:hypothetical protein